MGETEIDYQESLPECPECRTNLFVTERNNVFDYNCESCERTFDAERKQTRGRGGRPRT